MTTRTTYETIALALTVATPAYAPLLGALFTHPKGLELPTPHAQRYLRALRALDALRASDTRARWALAAVCNAVQAVTASDRAAREGAAACVVTCVEAHREALR